MQQKAISLIHINMFIIALTQILNKSTYTKGCYLKEADEIFTEQMELSSVFGA